MSERDGRLPCGAAVGELVDQVADGRAPTDSDHQRTCPYCRKALEELEPLWSEVRALASEELTVPGGLLTSVMRRVRRERKYLPRPAVPLEAVVPRLVRHAQLHGSRGTTHIADSVIATLIRRAALGVPGVRSLRRPAVTVRGHEVSAELALVVAYGIALPALVAEVRARVGREIERSAGLRLTAVDVAVVDLVTER